MGKDDFCINTQPANLASEIARVIQAVTPNEQDIVEIRRQLFCRHAELGLGKKVAPEEVIEGFFRCLLTDHLQRRFKVELGEIPSCINSSHTAIRGICIAGARHSHQHITDAEWKKAWPRFKDKHHEVNIYVPERRSALRADLYLVAQGGIVSVEFKYLGSHGPLNVEGCASQMRRYLKNHAATLLVIYTSSSDAKEVRGVEQLRSLLGPAVHVILVRGPAVPRVMTDIEKARLIFRDAGLAFPMIPEVLAVRLKEQGKWLFSTRAITVSPYNLQHYVREVDGGQLEDYALLCHSGHGVNSYALQYYLVHDSLQMFLHLGWGGVYMDAQAEAAKIQECFSLADEIILTAKPAGRRVAGDRLTIVASDFYGSNWAPSGETPREPDSDFKGPAAVLTEVLHWLRKSR